MNQETNKNQLEEFQKQILRSQQTPTSPTNKNVEVLKELLDVGTNILASLSNQVEKFIAELNKNTDPTFKTFATLTAEITQLKNQIKATSESLNKIKSQLDNPQLATTETKAEVQSAKAGYSTPLSFCHGSQQAAARQKAAAMAATPTPNNPESDASTKTKS